MPRVYVALGSNLGDREQMLRGALAQLEEQPGIELLACSSFRETEPVGFLEQPRFLNGVAVLETDLPARELLGRLLDVERRMGRTRTGPPLGPRTIDLDLLLYGDETIAEPGLQVPHPRLHERRFVLEPLAEVAPDLTVPGKGPVKDLLAALD